jgi:hypothetical protein
MLRIASERVAHETVDGEVVILDPGRGLYYSVTGAGAVVWELFAAGRGGSAAELASHFDAEAALVAPALAAFLSDLEREGLLVEGGAGDASPAATRVAWAEPRLERFTDLQGLLILDPIHEVDEAGWPRPARQA